MLEAIGAVIVAVLAAFFWGNRRGKASAKQEAKHERIEQTQAKVEAGRKAVAAGRGKPAADRLRANTDKWK